VVGGAVAGRAHLSDRVLQEHQLLGVDRVAALEVIDKGSDSGEDFRHPLCNERGWHTGGRDAHQPGEIIV
jgi:hypothetical protein